MTVRELIEKLQKCDQEAVVLADDEDGDFWELTVSDELWDFGFCPHANQGPWIVRQNAEEFSVLIKPVPVIIL